MAATHRNQRRANGRMQTLFKWSNGVGSRQLQGKRNPSDKFHNPTKITFTTIAWLEILICSKKCRQVNSKSIVTVIMMIITSVHSGHTFINQMPSWSWNMKVTLAETGGVASQWTSVLSSPIHAVAVYFVTQKLYQSEQIIIHTY